MFYERDKQVITLIQCLCSINAVKYGAQVTFRAGLHKVEISEFTRMHAFLDISASAMTGHNALSIKLFKPSGEKAIVSS